MKKEQFKRIYGIVLSLMLVICGILLMVQCVTIYRSGDHPFSREIVAAHFSPIAIPIYICIAMVLISFIVQWLIPSPSQKTVPGKQYRLILQKLQEKRNPEDCSDDLRNAIAVQQKKRKTLRTVRTALILICSAVFLSYGCNGANFDQMEINSSMVKAMYLLVPCCAIPFAWAVYTAYQEKASLQAEIELWKQLPLHTEPVPSTAAAVKNTGTLRNVILIAGIVLLVYGFFTGGTNDVLTKAINICTECVGLG